MNGSYLLSKEPVLHVLGHPACVALPQCQHGQRLMDVLLLLTLGREEGDSHSLSLNISSWGIHVVVVVVMIIIIIISLVPLINHLQMHLTVS